MALTADNSGEALLVGIRGRWYSLGQGDLYLSIIGGYVDSVVAAVEALFQAVYALLLWFSADMNAISDAMAAIRIFVFMQAVIFSIINGIANGALTNVLALFREAYALMLWFFANMNAIGDAMVAILNIVVFLLALILVFAIVKGFYKKTGIVMMPFEVSAGEGETINGRAISDLVASELQRISEIHKLEFKEVAIKSENLTVHELAPKAESLEHSLSELGTFAIGSTSLSLGHIIVAFKRHCPGAKPVPVLSGSLRTCGRMIILTACLEKRDVKSWVERNVLGKDQASEDNIQSIARDLAYRIIYDLNREASQRIEAKTWEGFKHYTDALVLQFQINISILRRPYQQQSLQPFYPFCTSI